MKAEQKLLAARISRSSTAIEVDVRVGQRDRERDRHRHGQTVEETRAA